ncbi:MAG: hypothetical protein ACMG5Z_02635 [Luteimonas sp.]
MRLPASIVMAAALLATTACAPANNDAIDGRAPPSSESASNDFVPSGAAGKISADQVGKVSPVPAFQGGGADWSIEIQSVGDMRHSIKLVTGDAVQTGTAVYQPTTTAPPQILLIGTLYATQGDRALRITLTRGQCRDAAGALHRHGVRIDIADRAPLQGCGDMAMY